MKKIKIEDMSFTSEQLSGALIALDELDILLVNDFNSTGVGRGICSFDTVFVNIERDDDGEFKSMKISTVNYIKRSVEETILLEYPEEFRMIPGLDYKKFCFHMFESDDPMHLDVELDYRLTEGFMFEDAISGPYGEDPAPEDIKVLDIVLKTENDNFNITDILDDDAKHMLFEYCKDYLEEHSEDLND